MPLWQAPWALLLGLSIPAIILLYLLRRRRPRRRIPSLLLWPGAPPDQQANAPWQRLRPRLILWLQLLLAALLTLAAARPLWTGGAGAGGVHRIFLLDASGSMWATDVSPHRFSAALKAVEEMARNLGGGDRLSVIRMDQQPRVLVAGATRPGPVLEALAGQSPGYGEADLEAALALAAALAGETGAAEWVLVTDGGLRVPEMVERRPGIAMRQQTVGEHGRNVALTSLALRAGEGTLAAQVAVANLGDQPVAGRVTLTALAGAAIASRPGGGAAPGGEGQPARTEPLIPGTPLGSQPFQLAPGESAYLTWTDLPQAPAYQAELNGVDALANALPQDDRALAVLPDGGRPRVLLVSEAGGFLEQALLAHGGLAVYRVKPEDYAAVGRGRYDLTIFAGWRPPAWPSGSVLVVGLPPGEGTVLPATATYRPVPATYGAGAAGHPVLRHVEWSEVHVAEALALELDETWQPLLVAAPADSEGGAGSGERLPMLAVQESAGIRRAVLAFALHQSDLPLRTAFPVLLTNLVEWLAPRLPELPQGLTPGTALPVPPLPLAEALELVRPDGSRTALAPPWPASPVQPLEPGLHQLVQVRTDGQELVSLVPVAGYVARESRIALDPSLPLTTAAGEPAPAQPWPLWPWLAAAALILSFIEWWVDARGL